MRRRRPCRTCKHYRRGRPAGRTDWPTGYGHCVHPKTPLATHANEVDCRWHIEPGEVRKMGINACVVLLHDFMRDIERPGFGERLARALCHACSHQNELPYRLPFGGGAVIGFTHSSDAMVVHVGGNTGEVLKHNAPRNPDSVELAARCTCDDNCDDPCPRHHTEATLQDRAIQAENEARRLRAERDALMRQLHAATGGSR